MSTPRTLYRCADCHVTVGADPRRWSVSETHWQPVCDHCWRARLEIDVGLHIAVASTLVREHGYLLDHPISIIRPRVKIGGEQ
jgi:hypothetical protein